MRTRRAVARRVLAVVALAGGLFGAGASEICAAGPLENGAILESADAFPYPTYEAWLEAHRREMEFDEARVRAEFPPEKFSEMRERMHIPAETHEQWIEMLRARSARMLARWPDMEAEVRRRIPPEKLAAFKEQVDCRRIVYASDGLRIEGFVLQPRTPADGVFPVVIYNHGGNPNVGSLDDTALLRLEWLVRAGFVVVASQYRGCGKSEGTDELGGADIDDVLNLVPVIDALPCADGTRIGMLGWSRGGMMTYLALARTDRIAAAVIGAAPTDFEAELQRRPEVENLLRRSIRDFEANREPALRARSVKYWPETLNRATPILLLHAADDDRSGPRGTLELAVRLHEIGQPFRLIFFESGGHGIRGHTTETNEQTIAWFQRHFVREAEGASKVAKATGP